MIASAAIARPIRLAWGEPKENMVGYTIAKPPSGTIMYNVVRVLSMALRLLRLCSGSCRPAIGA